ncbi:MAG: ribonuclease P protein component [Nitriliruptoraceae bacterium]
MTSTTERLRDSRRIVAVLRGRQQRAGYLLGVHAATDRDAGTPRVAVVASRRVGDAVNRNRAKRLLREASRRVSWRPGADIVLVARATCAESTLGDVERELSRLAAELDVGSGGQEQLG